MIKLLPAICFALIPFGFWGQNIFFGQANTLLLTGILLLFLSEQNSLKLNWWIRVIGIYLSGWVAFNFFVIFLGKYPPELSTSMIDFLLPVFVGMVFFLSIYRGDLPFEVWANVICIVATIQAVISILQMCGIDPIVPVLNCFVDVYGQMPFTTPTGTMGNQNFLAAFLAISLPFFFRGKWKWPLPIVIYALILTKTTTAIAAAIIGTVYFYFGWKWAIGSILPAFVIYAIKYNGTVLTNARVEYWLDAWRSTSHSWQTLLFGWGPGITWKSGNMLHSEYVNTFFSFGLIGVVLMVGYIMDVHKINKMLFSAFIVACIDMIGNHALHITTTATLILVVVALSEREREEPRRPSFTGCCILCAFVSCALCAGPNFWLKEALWQSIITN